MFSGEGISIDVEGETTKAIGFFTTRITNAETSEAAVKIAEDLVISEWKIGEYAANNEGSLPVLKVESVASLGFLEGLFRNPQGYTFYGADE